MVVNKRKKFQKYRGSHTHGGGAKKKRRGAGNKGGKGMAGSGKRADQKKPSIIQIYGMSYFGKKGFHRPQKVIRNKNVVNIDSLNSYAEKGKLKKEDGFYLVDLDAKVLGRGVPKYKFKIDCEISENAAGKIKDAGGMVNESDESSVESS